MATIVTFRSNATETERTFEPRGSKSLSCDKSTALSGQDTVCNIWPHVLIVKGIHSLQERDVGESGLATNTCCWLTFRRP